MKFLLYFLVRIVYYESKIEVLWIVYKFHEIHVKCRLAYMTLMFGLFIQVKSVKVIVKFSVKASEKN